MTLTCVEEVEIIHQGCKTYPRLYVRALFDDDNLALLDDVNLYGRGRIESPWDRLSINWEGANATYCYYLFEVYIETLPKGTLLEPVFVTRVLGRCEGVQQCAVELRLIGHPVECEVADLCVKDEWSFLCQLVYHFDVIEDSSLAEEGGSRYEDIWVEHLRALMYFWQSRKESSREKARTTTHQLQKNIGSNECEEKDLFGEACPLARNPWLLLRHPPSSFPLLLCQ
ncbi:hypothetical protein M5K25_008634 [Dendrobium thyrsiflorum]|uniref:Uncharacterized protein n=1 Tax=Dendrobium thyrsiflorum TaxID=117978 RepID=A0ABD0VG24_DENTH